MKTSGHCCGIQKCLVTVCQVQIGTVCLYFVYLQGIILHCYRY